MKKQEFIGFINWLGTMPKPLVLGHGWLKSNWWGMSMASVYN